VSEIHKQRVFVVLVLAIAAAILLPVLFGLPRGVAGQAGDGWRNFIYDFQTLIGGGAAIVAAWLTVRQMRITDEKSEARHRELVSLQIRADRLRVERLLYPSLDELSEKLEPFSARSFDVLSELAKSEPNAAVFAVNDFRNDCHHVVEILNRRTLKNALDLLSGSMTHTYERTLAHFLTLKDIADNVIRTTTNLSKVATIEVLEVAKLRAQLAQNLRTLENARTVAVKDLADLCKGLQSMGVQYGVH
jgi:hypothetical protein